MRRWTGVPGRSRWQTVSICCIHAWLHSLRRISPPPGPGSPAAYLRQRMVRVSPSVIARKLEYMVACIPRDAKAVVASSRHTSAMQRIVAIATARQWQVYAGWHKPHTSLEPHGCLIALSWLLQQGTCGTFTAAATHELRSPSDACKSQHHAGAGARQRHNSCNTPQLPHRCWMPSSAVATRHRSCHSMCLATRCARGVS